MEALGQIPILFKGLESLFRIDISSRPRLFGILRRSCSYPLALCIQDPD